MKAFIVAFVAFAAVAAAAGPWTNCGTASDHFKINSLTISPAELARGQPFTIALDGSLDETITGGSATISVQFLGITVFQQTYDACQLLSQGGKSCPVAAGPYTISKTETFPSGVPKGSYTGKLQVTDQNGQEVACISFSMKVTAPANHEMVLDDKLIELVNKAQNSWTAHRSPRFEGVTVGEVKRMLGAKSANHLSSIPLSNQAADLRALPTDFDGRTKWPKCIHPIRDQQQCGSCWAFSASEALSDRFCIASDEKINVVLSPQWLVSCDSDNYGCDGGYLDLTWEYLEQHGIPTDTCTPYTSGGGDSGNCPNKCKDGSTPKFYKVKPGSTTHPTSVQAIMTAVEATGPVQVAFDVYQDFMSYKGGVYKHTSGSLLGGHAVKVIGWGVENKQQYWLVANSWGTSWGLQGFFKILKGVNECGIEAEVYYGTPLIQ